jgi:hypothetical protein
LVAIPSIAACAVLAPAAWAAAPTPESATLCSGALTRAKATADDPNLLNYKFNCNTGITAYTLIANRGANDENVLDDFSSTASVLDPSGNTVSTQSFGCSGQIPGDGINCNAGAGGSMSSPNYAEGTIDTTAPYCPYLPAGAKPGAKAQPGAVIQLVVSDSTGAEDGPFRLRLRGKCPPVKAKAKPKARKKATKSTARPRTRHA